MYFNPLSTQYNLRETLGPYSYLLSQGQASADAGQAAFGNTGGQTALYGGQIGWSAQPMFCMTQPVWWQPLMMPQPQQFSPAFGSWDMLWNCMRMLMQMLSSRCCQPEPACPEPPPEEEDKIKGSAGLYGDPKFGLFTPGLDHIPSDLREFQSGIEAGETVTLLKDTDKGGLEVQGAAVQVNPADVNSAGIGSATFKSGSDTVVISGNGDLLVNGVTKGNLNDAGTIAPITLASGLTVSTGQEIDDAQGNRTERFVIVNGEYKITAATRKPHADSAAYLDMNFEELTNDAADNATGYQTTVTGVPGNFGIADLLRFEPDDAVPVA